MALSLRRVLSIAMGVASSNLLAVDAFGADMLVKPEREIHQSLYRSLKGEDEMTMNTSTTQAEESTSEVTATKAKATTSSSPDAMTTSEEEDVAAPKPVAIITGTASMSVANATSFCANDAALGVIENTMKNHTGATDCEVTCEVDARRLGAGFARRLEESLTLTYKLTVEAASADGFDESSPEVLNVKSKLEALDETSLQTMIQEKLDDANIDVEVTVLELSALEVAIVIPTTTTADSLVRVSTSSSSGLSAGSFGLMAAAALAFAVHT